MSQPTQSRPGGQSRPQTGQARSQGSGSGGFRPQGQQTGGGQRPAGQSFAGPRPVGQGGGQKPGGFGNKEKGGFRIFKNEEIKAPKILLLDENGDKIGVVSRFDALKKAEEEGMDLVQVAYNPEEMIATAKIVDFGKEQYKKKKTENEKKKSSKSKGQKEIKFGYNIGDNDLQMKIENAKKLLGEGYIVKMLAKLKGRENAYKDIVRIKFDFIEEELNKVGKSQGIKVEPSGFAITVMPKLK